MGDHITQKFRALYVKAQDTLGRWTATQSRASALVVSAAMVIERLPELADDQRFGPLKERFPTLPQATRVAVTPRTATTLMILRMCISC